MFAISGCVMDSKTGIVVINNNTSSSVLIAKLINPNITDSLVFLDDLDKTNLQNGEVRSIWLPYSNLKSLSSSEKVHFYIFSIDSLVKYRKLKKVQGIVKSSLIRRFSIQLNKVQDRLDTVYVIKQF